MVLTLATLTGATLVFSIQPMFGRLALPVLGGSPAVWTGCMAFFQVALLAGYVYAHRLSRLPLLTQALVHLGVLGVAAICLPIRLPAGWVPPPRDPLGWLLAAMSVSVGLPFLAVSATAPLTQRWLTLAVPQVSPYPLYAASNVGSLTALLAYPLLVERALTLGQQAWLWVGIYAALASLLVVAAWSARDASRQAGPNAAGPKDAEPPAQPAAAEPITYGRRLTWVALAALPCSLLLGQTAYLTTDITPIPLLWVVPLALYLLTFVNAFAPRPLVGPSAAARAGRIAAITLAVLLVAGARQPAAAVIVAHLACLTVLAGACHVRLTTLKPEPARLTEFYLWMSFGGAAGGMFNSLLAPLLFSGNWEYPLAVIGATLLLPAIDAPRPWKATTDLLVPVAMAAMGLGLWLVGAKLGLGDQARMVVMLAPLAVATLATSATPLRLGCCVAAILATSVAPSLTTTERTALRERSFFGVHHVVENQSKGVRRLAHGVTIHGFQPMDAGGRPTEAERAVSYYHEEGPLGRVMAVAREAAVAEGRPLRVGAVGLGVGVVAAYASAGDELDFYELDPVVVRIAEDPKLFTFMQAARERGAKLTVTLGDARLTLRDAPAARWDVLIVDAFSSDAIPVHLLTAEAGRLYIGKLRPAGLLAFHLSNKYVDLTPITAKLAEAVELSSWLARDLTADTGPSTLHKAASVWTVHGAAHAFRVPEGERLWHPHPPDPAARPWTDDFADVAKQTSWLAVE